MTRAGAADTSTEPSTSQAEGAKREGEPGPAGAPPLVARGKSDGTSVTTTEIDREKTAAEDGHAPPHSEPLNASQKNKQNQRAPTKMGTNLYDVSWSLEEQNTLEDGLRTYAEGAYESLWRYVKIAAKLPAKGVRDVALRVRWMKRKRAGEKTGAKRRKASGANGAGAGAAAGPEKKTKKAGEKGAGAEARRRAAQGARGAPSQGTAGGANSAGAGRPRSVFSMPMPGSAAAQNGLGPADGMGAGHPGARGGAGHILGGRMHGAPPGYGAMGGSQSQSHGMGTGVFPVPGVPGYAHQPPGMPPGMYPHAYPHAGMPPGLPPGAAAGSPAPPRGGGPHPSAHVLHPPPPAVPAGALEAHGGCEITAGVGAIDRRLYGQLVSNGVIIARLRDDDDARDANDFSTNSPNGNGADAPPRRVSSQGPSASSQTTLLSTNERLALLAEFRDALLDITESMRVAPGIMQRMPPLPVALDGALASALLPPPKTFLVSSRFGEQRGARSPMTFVPPTEVPTVTNGALPNGARAAKAPGASARMKSLQKQSSKKKDAARVSGKRAPKGAAAAPRANKKK